MTDAAAGPTPPLAGTRDGSVAPPEVVAITGPAAGGDGVARLADGRAVFVRGAIPGDRVTVTITESRGRFARGVVHGVLVPSADRVPPPCPRVADGCGGCGWQHIEPARQRALKAEIVTDALERIGGVDPDRCPVVGLGPDLSAEGWRTTVRAAVDGGRAGFHVHHGHDTVPVGDTGCLVAHPLVDEVLRDGRFGDAAEVTVRASAATGERLVVLSPTVPDDLMVPDGVTVVGADQLAAGHRAWLHEEVGGRRWRVSAASFFQSRPDGAAALAEYVAAALVSTCSERPVDGPVRLVDLYGGVGLLGGIASDRLRATGMSVELQLVEANRNAVADARVNLDGLRARLVRADVRRWRTSPADAVIADPSRHGLGPAVVDRIRATGARTVVLVSCDPGSLGRDTRLLTASGYRLDSAALVDLFPHTPHVEVVTIWHS